MHVLQAASLTHSYRKRFLSSYFFLALTGCSQRSGNFGMKQHMEAEALASTSPKLRIGDIFTYDQDGNLSIAYTYGQPKPQLIGREVQEKDREFLRKLFSDKQTMRFFLDGKPQELNRIEEDMQSYLEKVKANADKGYGVPYTGYTLTGYASKENVGIYAIKDIGEPGRVEALRVFVPEEQGKGYGTATYSFLVKDYAPLIRNIGMGSYEPLQEAVQALDAEDLKAFYLVDTADLTKEEQEDSLCGHIQKAFQASGEPLRFIDVQAHLKNALSWKSTLKNGFKPLPLAQGATSFDLTNLSSKERDRFLDNLEKQKLEEGDFTNKFHLYFTDDFGVREEATMGLSHYSKQLRLFYEKDLKIT